MQEHLNIGVSIMSSPIPDNLKVFISYSHDSDQHKDRVLVLSDRLRADGIDCTIDQYETSPPEGWARWCDRKIEEADFVLVACTQTYVQRFKGIDTTEKGKGVKWEGAIITQEIYEAQAKNKKFIPIIFTDEDSAHIPTILRGVTSYKVFTKEGYESLYRHLTSQPAILKPIIGKVKPMPPRERKQDEPAGSEIEGSKTAFWNVPFQRNPFFTGRKHVFEKLHEALFSSKIQVVNGLGGMGKTQIAVEYAYRYRNEYNAVLWSKADSHDALFSGFTAIAQVLDLREKDEKDQNKIAAAVHRWLDRNQQWLLILDNADDPAIVKDFIPQNLNGQILLTSRATVFDILGITKPEEIKKMTPVEAKEFLTKRTGQEAPSQAEKDALSDIAKELDYLPLALEQAGAYINRVKCSFSTYLSSYRGRGLKLLSKSPPVAGEYPESVATTWLLNFDMVEKANQASADLLKFSAFLNPDNIPLELIKQGAPELGEVISEALSGIEDDPLLLDELLMPLTLYSLITRDTVLNTYSIHRLVQAVIRDRMKYDEKRMWAERAVRAVNLAFPNPEFKNWHLCDRILPHALVCAGFIDEWNFEFEEAARLLIRAGSYLHDRAKYQEAEQLYERALAILEKSLGKDHPDVAQSLNNLAELYRAQGRFDEAEPMYERALAICKKTLGDKHPNTITISQNLAELIRKMRG